MKACSRRGPADRAEPTHYTIRSKPCQPERPTRNRLRPILGGGSGSIETAPIRIKHNYIPMVNMRDGVIKKDWPDEGIFVA